jgi:hypothetical protein
VSSRRQRKPWALRVGAALRDARRRLFALGVAVVLLWGSTAAGKAYLWCIPLQQAIHECCCAAEHEAPREQPAVRVACCDVQAVAALPAAKPLSPPPALPPVPVDVASLPAAVVEPAYLLAKGPPPRPARSQRYGLTRAGPRFASDACVRLQVLHC